MYVCGLFVHNLEWVVQKKWSLALEMKHDSEGFFFCLFIYLFIFCSLFAKDFIFIKSNDCKIFIANMSWALFVGE